MSSEEVLELSTEETNHLRAKLGMAPLRLTAEQKPRSSPRQKSDDNTKPHDNGDQEVLELSVDDTNNLRAKLGLAPLKTGKGEEVIHKPAENNREAKEAAERIERAKLKRQVQQGASDVFGSATLGDAGVDSALSWAAKMRKSETKDKKRPKSEKNIKENAATNYDENDLQGLQVTHNVADLDAGSTTVLTLADAPLLQVQDETSKKVVGLNQSEVALENVNLTEQKKQQDGLRKKRMLELGMGRAGGYAGFDDEEFEELGGTLGPARKERGDDILGGPSYGEEGRRGTRRGFVIGKGIENEDSSMTDFDKIQQGQAVSLIPLQSDVAANDYMTVEEEEVERARKKGKKKEKEGKFKKKKKKKDKKRRKTKVESDDEVDDTSAKNPVAIESQLNLLEHLEKTAKPESLGLRKRRRADSEDEDETATSNQVGSSVKEETTSNSKITKRQKYDQIMAKGNERTRMAFQREDKPKVEEPQFDEEPDDSFLNAALAKARRLNRLREMSKPSQTKVGADAIAEAVKSSKEGSSDSIAPAGGISFAIDDTREFTRAIQARTQQQERHAQKAKQTTSSANVVVKRDEKPTPASSKETVLKDVEAEDEDMDIEELATHVKPDDVPAAGLGGGTAERSGVGRGLSSFVSMLKTTGEISQKHNKEELRGRAKDEKNYDNYEKLNLKEVVKIGRNATDKDKELANREIKLEYRDNHGRLLTQKEAFRELCYQFHGHGAGKKKEEKRLKQIAREQAEARLASRQVTAARDGTTAGTLGALKATQKATGKAFIVHKTT